MTATEQQPWERAADEVYQRATTRSERVTVIRHCCDQHAAALTQENQRLREAAQKFVAKIELIHNDERYRSVWMINQIHNGPYSGPNYSEELAELRSALEGKEGKDLFDWNDWRKQQEGKQTNP